LGQSSAWFATTWCKGTVLESAKLSVRAVGAGKGELSGMLRSGTDHRV